MTGLKSAAKAVVPDPLWQKCSSGYWWWYNRGRHAAAGLVSQRRRRDIRRIRSYRDRHRGERCFILGNGPSLRDTDLGLLRGEVTFGLNRIYLLFESMGFPTTYFVSVNTLVLEQCAAEIKALSMPKFITWRGRYFLKDDPRVIFLDTDYTEPEIFARDITRRVFEGFTVTYVALQIAYYMGFGEVILVGVDHNFTTKGPANATVVSQGEDPNHFAPEYFGPGFRWQLPDLEGSERAYRMAKHAFEADGRRVLDATIGGRLQVFQKVDYLSLFSRRGT